MRHLILEKPDEMTDDQFNDLVRLAGGPVNADFRSSGRQRAVRIANPTIDLNLFVIQEDTEAAIRSVVLGW